MDFTNDKIPILLDPNQGLRAVGIQRLEDLNIKQLQKVAEGVNEKYRIKNYKALTKDKLISEIKSRFPHLAGKDGKLEDLSLKQLQALTTKYQQDYLIKNIKKLNKAQLIEAIRKVAPHLEETAEVRTATPEPEPEPEPVAPEVITPDPVAKPAEPKPVEEGEGDEFLKLLRTYNENWKLHYRLFKGKKKNEPYLEQEGSEWVFDLKGNHLGYKASIGYNRVFDERVPIWSQLIDEMVYKIPQLRKAYKAYYGEDPPEPVEPETEDETEEDTDGEEVDTVAIMWNGDKKEPRFLDEEGDIMNQDGDILAEKGEYRKDYNDYGDELYWYKDAYTNRRDENILFDGRTDTVMMKNGDIRAVKGNMPDELLAKPSEYQYDGMFKGKHTFVLTRKARQYRTYEPTQEQLDETARIRREAKEKEEQEKKQYWDVFQFIQDIETQPQLNLIRPNVYTASIAGGQETLRARVARTDLEQTLRTKDKMISSIMKIVAKPNYTGDLRDYKPTEIKVAIGNIESKIFMPLDRDLIQRYSYQLQNLIDLFPSLNRKELWRQLIEAGKYAKEAYGIDVLTPREGANIPREIRLPSGRFVIPYSLDFKDGGNFIVDYNDSQLEDLKALRDFSYSVQVMKFVGKPGPYAETYMVPDFVSPFTKIEKYIRGEPVYEYRDETSVGGIDPFKAYAYGDERGVNLKSLKQPK